MTNLWKESIIKKSLELIIDDSSIKKYYFIPWLLSIIFLTILLVYQSVYTYVELFWNKEKALLLILKFFHSEYVFEVIITTIIFILLYIAIIPLFEWWLIKYIEKKDLKNNCNCWENISHGLINFLPLFEYNSMFSEFKFLSVVNWYLFMLRFIWLEYLTFLNYVFIFVLILSSILNILFAYSKYFIVLEGKKMFEAIASSSKLAIFTLWTTIRLYLFMFILNIRIIINFIVFLLFPIAVISIISLITWKIFLYLTIILLSIVFIWLILFLGYLNSVLEVFKMAIWYYWYKFAKEKIEYLKWDKIIDKENIEE